MLGVEDDPHAIFSNDVDTFDHPRIGIRVRGEAVQVVLRLHRRLAMTRPFRLLTWSAAMALLLGLSVLFPTVPTAQTGNVHLNPVVEKLSQGRHVFGVSTSDLSLSNAMSLAGDPNVDYVYLDMEHTPLRFDDMRNFLAFITAGDKAGILQRGNAQVRPAVFARFPPSGREEALWMVKHALDIGLTGILINNLETREQAEHVVRTMRPSQRRDSKIPNPPGSRGTVTCGFWGLGGGDCRSRADLWPLNPEGDLFSGR